MKEMLSSVALAWRRHALKGNQLRRIVNNDRVILAAVETIAGHQNASYQNATPIKRCLSTHAVRTSNNQNPFAHRGQKMLSGIQEPTHFTVESVIENLEKASKFNQGKGGNSNSPKRMWNIDFVRKTVEEYEYCLNFFYDQQLGTASKTPGSLILEVAPEMKKLFLSPETTMHAFHALLRCKLPTALLSRKVREWEKYIGGLGKTAMTDVLSLRMLEANGKAGNVGRAITLLSVRKSRQYPAQVIEFVYAIKAIEAAGLYFRNKRNVFLPDKDQPQIDDPTRWLDAILLNMSQRDFPLSTPVANRMLNTYASTGKSGKALHYFYRISRTPLEEEDEDFLGDNAKREMAHYRKRPVKIRMAMRPMAPYHKIPSQVRGKLVHKPGSEVKQLKLDRESDPDWSPPLTAAISFADSLKQGACGHDPIQLDLISYSTLIKACVNRGSLWRAMHILDEVMPSQGIEPDVIAYNTLLTGLSKVGDVPTIREYYAKMLSKGIKPTKETIEFIVHGLLNLGDIATAITIVQDSFNQHSLLPPYTCHLKILEFALARGLVFEAKRHVYFLQQLWKWESNEYHSEEFSRIMKLTKKNPKLSKEALQKLFAYFGESLDDSDFF